MERKSYRSLTIYIVIIIIIRNVGFSSKNNINKRSEGFLNYTAMFDIDIDKKKFGYRTILSKNKATGIYCPCKVKGIPKRLRAIFSELDKIDPITEISTRNSIINRHPNIPIGLVMSHRICSSLPILTK